MGHFPRLCVVTILWLVIATLGGAPSVAYAHSRTPLSMTMSVHDTLVWKNCPTICSENSGSGSSPQLGAVTSNGLIVDTSIRLLPDAELRATTYETYVITAQNGDTLDVTNLAVGIEDLRTGWIWIAGRWIITGGTGQFNGATGGGTTSGTLQATDGLLKLSGTVTFVGTVVSSESTQ